jgi:serralysin
MIITGTNGADSLTGTASDDQITGLDGNDTISGLGGNDLIYGNPGNDEIDGLSGNDTSYGGQGNDFLDNSGAASGNDVMYGNLGNDTVEGGNDANDTIFGGQGDDSINGFGGNDLIYGNLGTDTLYGGAGADTFGFSGTSSGQTQATADHIADFSDAQGDRVDIATPPSGIRYVEAQGGAGVTSVETAVTFANSQNLFGPGGTQGNVVSIAGTTDGYLLVDADNSGSFGSAGDYAIVLDHLNSTSLFGPADVI